MSVVGGRNLQSDMSLFEPFGFVSPLYHILQPAPFMVVLCAMGIKHVFQGMKFKAQKKSISISLKLLEIVKTIE